MERSREEFLWEVGQMVDRDVSGHDPLLSLGLDSLGRVELAVLVEECFGSKVLQDHTLAWKTMTVDDLVAHARRTRRAPDFAFLASER